ncbi:MAG: glucokinase [Burkholderiales bacterium]|nr:glucokinase [Burkholderiales bacterium]
MILAGDIGGTKSRLALFDDANAPPRFEQRYASADYPALEPLIERFLAEARAALGAPPAAQAACFGIAGPIEGQRVQVTNLPWTVDAEAIARGFDVPRVRLVNDFAAAAYGLEGLRADALATLQPGEPRAGAPRVVLGAGTGLGIAYVLRDAAGERPLAGEGGHTGFAPRSATELALWQYLHARVGRVTLEHVLSGAGLMRIYDFQLQRGLHAESQSLRAELAESDAPAAITRYALERGEALALAALDLFIACYGAAAGDHALNVMARGGVYVAGGIAPKILPRLAAGGFVTAFNDKAGFADAARRMPLHVVLDERLPLRGAARAALARD